MSAFLTKVENALKKTRRADASYRNPGFCTTFREKAIDVKDLECKVGFSVSCKKSKSTTGKEIFESQATYCM